MTERIERQGGCHEERRFIRQTMNNAFGCGRYQAMLDSLREAHAGKMIMTVFAGIAEFERELIRERTAAGREAARSRGVRFGRPRKLNSEQEQLARRLIGEGKPVSEVAKTFDVHAATIYHLSAVPA